MATVPQIRALACVHACQIFFVFFFFAEVAVSRIEVIN